MNHADLVLSVAQTDGNHTAVQTEGEVLSYAEFAQSSEELGAGLLRANVRISDRVMMFAHNTVEHYLVYHALARIGAVFCPINSAFRGSELVYAITNSSPVLAVVSKSLLPEFELAVAKARHEVRIFILDPDGEAAGRRCLDELRLPGVACPPVDVAPEHPLLICYTSGTTSMPKPVLRSHGAETWSAHGYRQGWGFDESDRMLVALPLSWVYGLCTLSQTMFAARATIVLDRKFSPTRTLNLLSTREATAFAGSMSLYAMMLSIMKQGQFEFPGHYKLYLGGEPRNEVAVAEVEKLFDQRLCEAWATSETFPTMTVNPVRDRDAPKGSLGKVVPGVEVRLIDADGNDVPDNTPGEAIVRGPGDFLGYYREPRLTADRCDAAGWIYSGDLLSRDSDGYYTFITRRSELIIRGGTNISPAEIESAICAHPAVADAVVVGLPDEVLGEQVIALVIPSGEAEFEATAVQAFLGERIARFKVPSGIYSIEAMPAGGTGKKNRSEARKLAESLHFRAS
jgi:long-chain acyl-CoA synthetase